MGGCARGSCSRAEARLGCLFVLTKVGVWDGEVGCAGVGLDYIVMSRVVL